MDTQTLQEFLGVQRLRWRTEKQKGALRVQFMGEAGKHRVLLSPCQDGVRVATFFKTKPLPPARALKLAQELHHDLPVFNLTFESPARLALTAHILEKDGLASVLNAFIDMCDVIAPVIFCVRSGGVYNSRLLDLALMTTPRLARA